MDFGFVHQGPLSSSELRKIRKPIIERRRRERINRCLDQIKSLVLKALNQDESKYEKMDKADILEMAVRHLVDLQRTSMSGTYRAGYQRCAAEVKQYLHQAPKSVQSEDIQKRLLGHLNHGFPCPAATPPAGICRPQPIMASATSISSSSSVCDGEHPVTRVSRGYPTDQDEDDSYLDCSAVSSTSSVSALSPVRERHDSGLSEDYPCASSDKNHNDSGIVSDIHDYSNSAFRKVISTAQGHSASTSGVDHTDNEVDTHTDSRPVSTAQRATENTSPVWRPW